MRGLKGKNIIITGGGGGIGGAVCRRLGEEGVNVGVLDLNEEAANTVAQQIRDAGGNAWVSGCDITDYEGVQATIARFESEVGPLNGLVNNAGWDLATRFADHDDRTFWDKVIRINLYGVIHMCHVALKSMRQNGGGMIVNVASDAGRVGSSGEAVYSACKGGIIAFTKTLARESARKNIVLNTVCPGPTDTALLQGFDETGKLQIALAKAIPLGRLGLPDDYPGIIGLLLSDDAKFITGQTISVSGGLTMHG